MYKFAQEANALALILVEIEVEFDRIAHVKEVIVERLLVEALAERCLHERVLAQDLVLDSVFVDARFQRTVEVQFAPLNDLPDHRVNHAVLLGLLLDRVVMHIGTEAQSLIFGVLAMLLHDPLHVVAELEVCARLRNFRYEFL